MFTDTVMLSCSPVEEPLVGLRESQLAASLTLQFKVPLPLFHTSSV
jgi:hypothetical protein